MRIRRSVSRDHRCAGLTFIELLVAILIVSIAICGMLQMYIGHSQLSEVAGQKAVAQNDARDMMEKINCTPTASIVADYPNGVANGATGTEYATRIGGYSLSNEFIVVNYTNPLADPLEIIVTVSWRGPLNRPLQLSLSTMKAE